MSGQVARLSRLPPPLALLALVALGLERLWLPLLIAGIAWATLGRSWYCGRVCPVSAAVDCASALRGGKGSGPFVAGPAGMDTPGPGCPGRRRPGASGPGGERPPPFLRSLLFRRLWLGSLAAVFVACLAGGARVGLFVGISLLGLVFSLRYSRSAWCGLLCPWGFLMRGGAVLAGRRSTRP